MGKSPPSELINFLGMTVLEKYKFFEQKKQHHKVKLILQLIKKVFLHEVTTAQIYPSKYPKALGIVDNDIMIDFLLDIPNWSIHTGKYIDINDWENPVNILQKLNIILDEILVGIARENIIRVRNVKIKNRRKRKRRK